MRNPEIEQTPFQALKTYLQQVVDIEHDNPSGENVVFENGHITTIYLPDLHRSPGAVRALTDMEIYPYPTIVSGVAVLTINYWRDIKKLELNGFLTTNTTIDKERGHEYGFPFPALVTAEKNAEPDFSFDDSYLSIEAPEAVDRMIEQYAYNFDQGFPHDFESEEHKSESRKYPNRKLFPSKYKWEKGKLYTSTGEEISRDERKEMMLKAKEDPKLKEEMVHIHIGLIFYVLNNFLKKFSPSARASVDDFFAAGLLGLVHAIEHVDEEKYNTTYLIKCIEGMMRREVRKSKEIVIPSHRSHLQVLYYRALNTLRHDESFRSLSADLQIDKIIEYIQRNFSNEPIDRRLLQRLHDIMNLVMEEFDDNNLTHVDMTFEPRMLSGQGERGKFTTDPLAAPEDIIFLQQLTRIVTEALVKLKPMEERIVRMYFFENLIPTEIAEIVGIPYSEVRKVLGHAVRKLKHPGRGKPLLSALKDLNN